MKTLNFRGVNVDVGLSYSTELPVKNTGMWWLLPKPFLSHVLMKWFRSKLAVSLGIAMTKIFKYFILQKILFWHWTKKCFPRWYHAPQVSNITIETKNNFSYSNYSTCSKVSKHCINPGVSDSFLTSPI
jgi:hypothetical protein